MPYRIRLNETTQSEENRLCLTSRVGIAHCFENCKSEHHSGSET